MVGSADKAPDTDPFHGPLRVPLLAPLLDPTTPEADDEGPPAVPTPIRPVPAQPAVDEPAPQPDEAARQPDEVEGEVDGPEPVTSSPSDETRPVTPVVAAAEPAVPAEVPDDVPQEWQDDWRSGDWAMPPAGLPQPPAEPAAFDVFETPAPPVEDNAVERTGRTELPTRTAPDRLDPAPPAGGSQLPFHASEGARPAPGLFGAGHPQDTEGTAAFPPRRAGGTVLQARCHVERRAASGPPTRRCSTRPRPASAPRPAPPHLGR